MCGITGFVDYRNKTKKETLENMTDALFHRGPDDGGYFFEVFGETQVGLGHRRLSILDLSSHGHQPMIFNHLTMVYNGEIYNFKEVRTLLEKYDYSFESHSDTEVILKAYDKWGIEAVHHFNGMFAIAIFDTQRQTLTLIRDRSGVKPLYWYQRDDLFMFSSELKSFHKHPKFEKEINKDAVALYFKYSYILEPYTIFKHTHKLPAGHYAELNLQNRKFEIYKYWDVIDCYNKPKLDIGFEEAKEETHKLLKSACEYRMVSDVPVGMFLSGGYDSSAVTAILQKDRTEKLKTFSIGFHEKKYNEAHYAKEIAKHLGTDHTEYYCTQKDAQELLPLMAEIWDEPFGDSSNIPTTLVSRLARNDVAVSLSADGGDEIFGGYSKYTQSLKFQKMFSIKPLSNIMGSIMEAIDPKYLVGVNKTCNFANRYEKLKAFLNAKDEIDMMNNITYYFNSSEVDELLGKTANVRTSFDDKIFLNSHNDIIDRMMAIDYKTYQLDDILTKVDRATMSTGLEGREPFLDHRIIEFVSKLPSKYKINNGNKKYILKSIVHDYIPQKMMDRPKMGFSIPLNEWFGDELKKYIFEYLDSEKVAKTEVLNIIEVEKLKKQWLENNNLGTNKIWLLLMFMMWHERWMK